MNSMNTIPAEIVPKDDIVVECTIEEKDRRTKLCVSCENFYIDLDQHTKCQACDCNIGFMVSFNFKKCPKGNW